MKGTLGKELCLRTEGGRQRGNAIVAACCTKSALWTPQLKAYGGGQREKEQ